MNRQRTVDDVNVTLRLAGCKNQGGAQLRLVRGSITTFARIDKDQKRGTPPINSEMKPVLVTCTSQRWLVEAATQRNKVASRNRRHAKHLWCTGLHLLQKSEISADWLKWL